MVRKTSIEVFRKIEADGLLSKLRFAVYKCLYDNGPMTAMEICSKLKIAKQVSISPRMSELVERRVVEEIGEKICSITNHRSIIWATTNELPFNRKKPQKIKCCHCKGRGYFLQERLL